MSVAALAIVLAAACALFGLVLNHIYARLALIELTLNEGLPPGHENADPFDGQTPALAGEALSALLSPGVHIFASRNCLACQRLLDELDAVEIKLPVDLHLRYVDRPRPLATSVAHAHDATLHIHQEELAARAGADPLPYTIAIGQESLASRSVTPTVALVLETARNAGLRASASPT